LFSRQRRHRLIENQFILAVIATVKAKHAFAYPDIASRLTAALTGFFAQSAIDAFVLILADSPEGESVDYAEQCPQWADKSAVKSRDNQVKQDRSQKHSEYQPCTLVESPRY